MLTIRHHSQTNMVKTSAYAPNVGQTRPQSKPGKNKGNSKVALVIILVVLGIGILFFLFAFFIGSLIRVTPTPPADAVPLDQYGNPLPDANSNTNSKTPTNSSIQTNPGVDDIFQDTDVAPPGLPN